MAVPSCSGSSFSADKTTTAPDFRRSNVPTCDGRYVTGFQILSGSITWYVDSQHANECFDVDVNVLPTDVKSYDIDAIRDFLDLPDIDVYERRECKIHTV